MMSTGVMPDFVLRKPQVMSAFVQLSSSVLKIRQGDESRRPSGLIFEPSFIESEASDVAFSVACLIQKFV